MRTWAALYDAHCGMREERVDHAALLRHRLIELSRRGHCEETIQGRFTWRKERGQMRELYIQSANGREPLRALPHLDGAHLTVLALISHKDEHLHQFTAMIEGTARDGSSWVAAVHLEDDRQPADHDRRGTGACGHAAFHCHVGPTMDREPKVRVPLPAIGPAGALDWLLSIVVPGWEPAPWAELGVRAADR